MSKIKAVIEYILNSATEGELDVVLEAVNRRRKGSEQLGGLNLNKMAQESSKAINNQMGLDRGRIRDMVRDMAVKIIAQNAPELNESQVEELLDHWVPNKPPVKENADFAKLPPDVMQTMIRQFLAFSMNTMSITEQDKLRTEMPDWYEQYWKMFPDNLQWVLKDYIEGRITENEYNVRLDDVMNRI